jgi:hypothetical protein
MADSLVGRVEIVELWPFSEMELRGTAGNVVDLLHDDPEQIVRSSRLLRDRLGDRFRHGYLATTAPEAHPIGDRLSAIPVGTLWN